MANANSCQGPTSNPAFLQKIIIAQRIILGQGQNRTPSLNTFQAAATLDISRPASPPLASTGLQSPPVVNPHVLPSHHDVLQMVDTFFDNTGKFFPYLYKPYILRSFANMRRTSFQNVERSQLCILNLLMAFATTHCPSDLPASARAERGDVFLQRALLLIPDIKPAAGNLEPSTYLYPGVDCADDAHSTGAVDGNPIYPGDSEIVPDVGYTWQAHTCGLSSRPVPTSQPSSLYSSRG